MAATFTITVSSYAGFRYLGFNKTESIFAAAFTSFFISSLKEVLDKNVDQGDLKADAQGTAAAMLGIAIFHF